MYYNRIRVSMTVIRPAHSRRSQRENLILKMRTTRVPQASRQKVWVIKTIRRAPQSSIHSWRLLPAIVFWTPRRRTSSRIICSPLPTTPEIARSDRALITSTRQLREELWPMIREVALWHQSSTSLIWTRSLRAACPPPTGLRTRIKQQKIITKMSETL